MGLRCGSKMSCLMTHAGVKGSDVFEPPDSSPNSWPPNSDTKKWGTLSPAATVESSGNEYTLLVDRIDHWVSQGSRQRRISPARTESSLEAPVSQHTTSVAERIAHRVPRGSDQRQPSPARREFLPEAWQATESEHQHTASSDSGRRRKTAAEVQHIFLGHHEPLKIEKRLAAGSFGDVFRAKLPSGRAVAIKVVAVDSQSFENREAEICLLISPGKHTYVIFVQ